MKILSTKTICTSRYFTVEQKVIERNGRKYTKEFVERNSVVFIIPYTNDNEIYLERQYRDAFGKELIEVVAGHIDNDDSPLETAKRELKEETGLTAKTWKRLATWELAANMRQTIYVFAATDLEQRDAQLEIDEQIEVFTLPLAEALMKIEKGEIVVGTHIASLLLFDKLQKEGKL